MSQPVMWCTVCMRWHAGGDPACPPLVGGGQGRDGEDIKRGCFGFVVAAASILALACILSGGVQIALWLWEVLKR